MMKSVFNRTVNNFIITRYGCLIVSFPYMDHDKVGKGGGRIFRWGGVQRTDPNKSISYIKAGTRDTGQSSGTRNRF